MKTQTRIEKIQQQLTGLMIGIQNGTNDPLYSFIELKRIMDATKHTLDAIKPDAMAELEKHGKGEHAINGAICSVSNVGGRWDFKHVPEWMELKTKMTEIESKLKTAYKSNQNGLMSVNSDSGEIMELPKYSGSTETLKIRLLKKLSS